MTGRQYFVYILTNKGNRVLYTGVTRDLPRRMFEHREKLVDGFTKKYNVHKLVYFEVLDDPENAILREKQIKAGSRQKKLDLIKGLNPEWRDLCEDFLKTRKHVIASGATKQSHPCLQIASLRSQ